MSTKRLITLVLLGGALFGLYAAGAPAKPPARPAGAAGLKQTALATPARLGHGLGVIGARIVAPAVNKTVSSTQSELLLLRQDLKTVRTTQTALYNANVGADKVAALNNSALASLQDGRPVRAFRDAMQANALVTAVHDNLRRD